MLILGIMAVGVLIGMKWIPNKFQKINTYVQLGCTVLLVFCMGVMLGRRENFWQEMGELGLWGLLLAVLPIAGSALVVWSLTECYEKHKKGRKDR